MVKFIYRAMKRLIPLDVTRVYLRTPNAHHEMSSLGEEINCCVLNNDELHRLAFDTDFAITPKFLQHASEPDVHSVGVSVNDSVVAMCCFAQGDVPAYLNTGGAQFQGIGLSLPANASYIFKVFVKAEHRGKRLVSEMIQFALRCDELAVGQTLITTSDISNDAFRKSTERLGFQSAGYAAEAVVLGKHFFKCPSPIQVEQTTKGVLSPGAIVLKKPH